MLKNIEKSGGISEAIKKNIPLPILQVSLTALGGFTEILLGHIPGISQMPDVSRSFVKALQLDCNVSKQTQEILSNFSRGIILASHNNGNMADFPAFLKYMNPDVTQRMIIPTGRTVTPMYRILFPNAETFCAEIVKLGDKKRIKDYIENAIQAVNNQEKVAFLPYKPLDMEKSLPAIHSRILKGVNRNTPVLHIDTCFSTPISYMGINGIYPRLFKGFFKSLDPISIQVEVEEKKSIFYSNQ